MKASRKKKLILIAMLLVLLVLSGCVAKQDQTNNGNSGQGNTDKLPWDVPVLTTVPPSTTPTAEIGITTMSPGPDTSGSISPYITPSGGPDFTTPTLSPMQTVTLVPTQVPTSTPAPTATPLILKLGSTGAEVRNMQSKLRTLGYLSGPADGDFGKATETALKAFQSRNKLTADGIAGPATLNRLNSAGAVRAALTPKPTATPRPATPTPRVSANVFLRIGDSGAEVRRMQNRLIDLGYLTGNATGNFGASTQAAVIAFQKRNVSYYDGVAGPLTLSKLYSDSARRASGDAVVIGESLKLGLKNSDAVRTLQRRLKDLRYYLGEIDGDFGANTELAVRSFQANNNLRVDGAAGEQTLNLLYSGNAKSAGNLGPGAPDAPRITPIPAPTPIITYYLVTPNPTGEYVTLRAGSMGTLVTRLQQELKNRGYYTGTVDGKYGLGTIEAVKRFQEDHGLSQDGDAGAATQRVLYEGSYPIGS